MKNNQSLQRGFEIQVQKEFYNVETINQVFTADYSQYKPNHFHQNLNFRQAPNQIGKLCFLFNFLNSLNHLMYSDLMATDIYNKILMLMNKHYLSKIMKA